MSVRNRSVGRGALTVLMATAAIATAPASQAADVGMRVIRDANTGQLRAPTAEEVKAMDEAEARGRASSRAQPAAQPMVRRHANGAVGYHVGDTFMTYSVAKRNADGTTSVVCVPGAEAADKVLSAPQAATDKGDDHAHK
jgi:hypothetical protein